MIPRYNRPKIEKIWTLDNKFKIWTEIECLIAEKLSLRGTPAFIVNDKLFFGYIGYEELVFHIEN